MNTSRNCKVWHRVSRVSHKSGTIKAACGTGKPLSGVRWKTGSRNVRLRWNMLEKNEEEDETVLVSLFLLTRPWVLPSEPYNSQEVHRARSFLHQIRVLLSILISHPHAIQTGRENVKGTYMLLNEKCSEEVRNKVSGLFKVAWLPSA